MELLYVYPGGQRQIVTDLRYYVAATPMLSKYVFNFLVLFQVFLDFNVRRHNYDTRNSTCKLCVF